MSVVRTPEVKPEADSMTGRGRVLEEVEDCEEVIWRRRGGIGPELERGGVS